MRIVLGSVLFGLVCLRLGSWKREQDRARDLCALLEARRSRRENTVFQGAPRPEAGETMALEEVIAEGEPVELEVRLAPVLGEAGLRAGRKIMVSGPVSCRRGLRNPLGRDSLRLLAFGPRVRSRVLDTPVGLRLRGELWFRGWVDRRLGGHPGLKGLSLATWTGDGSQLPESLQTFYREGGVLHVIALSGQHLAVLALLLGWVGELGIRLLSAGGWTAGVRWWAAAGRWRSFAAALALVVTSHGIAPLKRVLGLLVSWEILHHRRFHGGALSLLASSAAAWILWDPRLLGSASFLLSAVATGFYCRVMAMGGGWRGYLRGATLMPILTAPVSAHFFGKLPWLAPLWNALLAGVWGVLWLPVGFAAPLLPEPLARLADWGWGRFLWAHDAVVGWGPVAYGAVPRPSLVEVVAWEILLAFAVRSWLAPRARSWGSLP